MNLNDVISEAVKKAVVDALIPSVQAITETVERLKQDATEPYLSPNRAAKYLDITRQSLDSYVKNGIVVGFRLNGNPRFKKKDLDAAMKLIEIKPLIKHRAQVL